MSDKRRSFFGWGYEDEAVSAEELSWFERAWSKLFEVDHFDAVPMPRESESRPRVPPAPSLKSFCTDEKYDRLYGRSVHDLTRMIHRHDFANPPDVVAYSETSYRPCRRQRPGSRRSIADDREFDAVEIREILLPVVFVPGELDRLVLLELDELVWAGTD